MLLRTIVTLVFAGLATIAAADTVYKWVDTSGQVHYTDLPPDEAGAKLLGVFERSTVLSADEAAGSQDEPAQTYDSEPALAEEETARTAAAVQRDLDQMRSEQCKKAQERYKTAIESRRLYRTTEDGGREYLTDEELSAARIDAKQAVDEYCQ